MTPGAPQPWRVVYLAEATEQIRSWFQAALLQGLGQEFLDSTRIAAQRLAADPEGWGDPLFRFVHLGLMVYRGMAPLFLVQYAVDASNYLVYVMALQPRPGSPLTGSTGGR